jgi:hypothetical protein
MRSKLTFFVISSFLFIFSAVTSAFATPYYQHTTTSRGVAVAVALQIPRSQAAAIPLIHLSSSQPRHALNHFKGEFGERLMHSTFTSTGWSRVTPMSIGRNGIDGLYLNVDGNGVPRNLLVSEAKYGSAKLGMTKDGTQMSDGWRKQRLSHTAKMYRNLSEELRSKKVLPANGTLKNRASGKITVPLNNRVNIEIWRNKNGAIRYFCTNKNISRADIQRQLNRCADYFDGAASGKINYRSRLFSYKPNGKEHNFIISELDNSGRVISKRTIKGEFHKLPSEYRNLIKSTVRTFLRHIRKSTPSQEINVLTDRICESPDDFNQLCMEPRNNLFRGLDKGAFKVAGIAALVGAGADVVAQYMADGQIDIKRTAVTSGVVFSSVVAGNYVGTQLSEILGRSPILSKLGGITAGGSVASILVAGGLWITGYTDGKTALKSAAKGIAASGVTSIIYAAPQIAMWYASTYGVASSGVAIASLHGAAQTSAVLAYLGGGSLAAGGGGVAGGTIVVTALSWTGPVVVVAGAVYSGYNAVHYFMNKVDQNRYLTEIIRLTKNRVQTGDQPEWKFNLK